MKLTLFLLFSLSIATLGQVVIYRRPYYIAVHESRSNDSQIFSDPCLIEYKFSKKAKIYKELNLFIKNNVKSPIQWNNLQEEAFMLIMLKIKGKFEYIYIGDDIYIYRNNHYSIDSTFNKIIASNIPYFDWYNLSIDTTYFKDCENKMKNKSHWDY